MSAAAPASRAPVAHLLDSVPDAVIVATSSSATPPGGGETLRIEKSSPGSPVAEPVPAPERPEHWEDLEDPAEDPPCRPAAIAATRSESNASIGSDAASPFAAIAEATGWDPKSGMGPEICSSSSAPWSLRVIRNGMSSDQGNRHYMEDRQIAVPDLERLLTESQCSGAPAVCSYFGVFDGHGGECAADFASQNMLGHILAHDGFPNEMEEAMASGFLKTDMAYEAICKEEEGEEGSSGTTAVAAMLWGREMTVANLGDSRAVVSRRGKAVELSRDQKPSTDSERKRIVAAGGFVCPEGFLNSVLGVSRAIGNWQVRDHDDNLLKRRVAPEADSAPGSLHATLGPLISVPEVRTHRVGPDDEFMVIATDGLWDVFSSQRCIEVARMLLQEKNDPEHCAEGLVKKAMEMNTTDNVSVQVVCFNTDPPPMRRPSAFSRNFSVESLSKLRAALSDTSTAGAMGASPASSSMGLERLDE